MMYRAMSVPIRSQLLLINSTGRVSGTPSDFIVAFHSGCVHAKPGHTLTMVVIDACINRSWYTVNANNNTFGLNLFLGSWGVVPVTIPPGFYDVYSLRSALQALISATVATYAGPTNVCTVAFSAITNTFTFGNTKVVFGFTFSSNRCSEFLGFGPVVAGATLATATGNTVASTAPVKVNLENAILVHCDVPRRSCSILYNTNGGVFGETDVILKICNQCAPFDNMVYQSQGNDNYSYNLSVSDVIAMRFYLTDENNTPLPIVFDWSMTLKLVEYSGDDDRILGAVRDIKDYLNLIVLDKHMK